MFRFLGFLFYFSVEVQSRKSLPKISYENFLDWKLDTDGTTLKIFFVELSNIMK
jgi:hypothetical protein